MTAPSRTVHVHRDGILIRSVEITELSPDRVNGVLDFLKEQYPDADIDASQVMNIQEPFGSPMLNVRRIDHPLDERGTYEGQTYDLAIVEDFDKDYGYWDERNIARRAPIGYTIVSIEVYYRKGDDKYPAIYVSPFLHRLDGTRTSFFIFTWSDDLKAYIPQRSNDWPGVILTHFIEGCTPFMSGLVDNDTPF